METHVKDNSNMENIIGGVIAKKHKTTTKTRKRKLPPPADIKGKQKMTELSYLTNSSHMDIERSKQYFINDYVPMEIDTNPADLLTGTPQSIYDKTKPSEITIYIAGHGEEIFPRKGQESGFPEFLTKLSKTKNMRVRIINKVNAPLVEGLAMIGIHDNKITKTEDAFYGDALELFQKNRKMDTKKILKQLGKDYINKYKEYLNILGKNPDKYANLVKLKREILNKSNYLDIYHPTHEKIFYVRPEYLVHKDAKDDTSVLRYGIYIVDIRNSPHENAFFKELNISPMAEEYNNNKSMYLDLISYLKLFLCSGDSLNELTPYIYELCGSIERLINPASNMIITKLSELLILFYYLGFSQINIIDSTCRVDCGSNVGVCSVYKVDNTSTCNYNIKKSLIKIAKLKKDLSVSPYTAETSAESGVNPKPVVLEKTRRRKMKAFKANIERKFTRKIKA